jgi:outer membrane protein assembly factor BamB
MKRFWTVVFAAVLMAASAVNAEGLQDVEYGKELWKAKFEKEILWQELTGIGYLIVCTEDALYCVNPTDGQTIWSKDEYRKLDDDYFDVLPSTQFAVVLKKSGVMGSQTKLIFIDVSDGKEMWSSKECGLTNAQGQFYVPQLGGVLMFGTNEKGKAQFLLADIQTGQPKWNNTELFKATGSKAPQLYPIRQDKKTSRMGIGGNQLPVYLPDGSFIEFWSKQGIHKINGTTGEVLWTLNLKSKGVPGMQAGYCPFLITEDNNTLYVPYDQTMQAVDLTTGKTKWAKPAKLKGTVYQMSLTDQGLVVKGAGKKAFIDVLNPETGASNWKKPFRDLENASSYEIQGEDIVLYADNAIHKINIASGESREVARKIKLDGDDIPHTLEIRDGGYLLISSNNLMYFDGEGAGKWHTYYKAPGASMFNKIATTALVAATNAASAAAAHDRAMQSAYSGGSGTAEYTLISNPVLSQRLKASAESDNNVYILTNIEGGSSGSTKNAGLVKVSKLSGSTERRVALGTKKPEYEVDEIDHRIFFMSESNEITCYDM